MPVVIPLLAFGVAYGLAMRNSESTGDTPLVDDVGGSSVPPVPDSWSELLYELRGDVDADFLSRWIARESGGNPCSKGSWGGPWEAGIGQLYFDKTQRNSTVFGVTLDDLRAACVMDSQEIATELTYEQRQVQVASLVAMASKYLSIARERLQAIGEVWSDVDIQCLAKLYHALPVLVSGHLSVASRDGHTSSWEAYSSYMSTMTRDGVVAMDRVAGYEAGSGAAPFFPIARLFVNASTVGRGY
jgi:hypothetical protein